MPDEEPVQEADQAAGTDGQLEAGPGTASEGEAVELPLARLTDRFLAYAIDALLFLIPAQLTLQAYWPKPPVPAMLDAEWHMGWLGLYLVYQALFNSGGRATLGKKLLGIRVVTVDGEELSFAKAFLRSVGYIVSGFAAELGFLWAVANPMRQTWHDLLAGTIVLEDEERGPLFRGLASLVSAALFCALAFLSIRNHMRHSPVAEAKRGLAFVAELEEQVKAQTGQYTENVYDLSNFAGGGAAFKAALAPAIQPDSFGVKVENDKYFLQGTALDGTAVRLSGPKKKSP